MRKAPLVGPLLVLLAVSLVGAGSEMPAREATDARLRLFTEVLDLIEAQYVEPVPPGPLIDDAIGGALAEVDPDGAVIGRAAYRELGGPGGPPPADVGLDVARRGGRLTVVAAIEGTPAARARLEPGDVVVKIDGVVTRDLPAWEAAGRLRGEPGTRVALAVLRNGAAEPKELTLTREDTTGPTVRSRQLAGGIAYLAVRRFQAGTADELRQALETFSAPNLSGLVLDLRNDPGGDVDAAVGVAETFLPRGRVVVAVRSRVPAQRRSYAAAGNARYLDMPMVVLVNRGSATASEIVAGALQDEGRAVVLGARSFGRASAQSLIQLSDGSVLRLTTARYVTPKGRSIDGTGLTPDIVVEARPGAPDDPQLARALEVIKVAQIVGANAPAPRADAGQ
jgi:carboxyl-terminal processing protease